MRFVVYGAGAVGGVIGAHLFRGGHDVTLIARGAHQEAIRERGLRFDTPERASRCPSRWPPAPPRWSSPRATSCSSR